MIEENYTGLPCPEPVIRCKKFISEQQHKQFVVIVDNEPASENIERFLKKNSYIVNVSKENSKKWLIFAQLEDGAEFPSILKDETSSKTNSSSDSTNGKTLVIIPSEFFGVGDDELGSRLMENFLATLPELGESLWKVVLLNGGVKLSAQPGKSLDALQNLEKSGIEILVCGTCLEFFTLTSQKQVGQSTNMLDIVTSIDLASKVIRV